MGDRRGGTTGAKNRDSRRMGTPELLRVGNRQLSTKASQNDMRLVVTRDHRDVKQAGCAWSLAAGYDFWSWNRNVGL